MQKQSLRVNIAKVSSETGKNASSRDQTEKINVDQDFKRYKILLYKRYFCNKQLFWRAINRTRTEYVYYSH